jgi:phospholipid transport system substrate-binding protein
MRSFYAYQKAAKFAAGSRNAMKTPPLQTARTIRVVAIAALLALGAIPDGAVAAPPPDAEAAVRGFYQVLLATMQNGGALGASGRNAKLEPAVLATFDIPHMTQAAAGPSWGTLSEPEQRRLVRAFGHYVVATWAQRFASYSGEQLEVTGERPYGVERLVETEVVPSDGEPVSINYLMRENGGAWQIADVYLSGTISQLAVQRSEFMSVLNRAGPVGLIQQLNDKATLLAENAAP